MSSISRKFEFEAQTLRSQKLTLDFWKIPEGPKMDLRNELLHMDEKNFLKKSNSHVLFNKSHIIHDKHLSWKQNSKISTRGVAWCELCTVKILDKIHYQMKQVTLKFSYKLFFQVWIRNFIPTNWYKFSNIFPFNHQIKIFWKRHNWIKYNLRKFT